MSEQNKTAPNKDQAPPNKLGITSAKELEIVEGVLTYGRINELKQEPIKGNFDEAHLKAIHQHIFQDVYDHAGQFHDVQGIRTKVRVSEVTGENTVVYYPTSHVAKRDLDDTLQQAGGVKAFSNLDHSAFSKRMAVLYQELDYMHPFPEGNSRTLRAFTEQLANESGRSLDWNTANADGKARDALYAVRDKAVLQEILPKLPDERMMVKASQALRQLEKHESLEKIIAKNVPLLKRPLAPQPLQQPQSRSGKAKIFVFGSNLAGRHGKGAALFAKQHHGAIYGQGEGLQGSSYAIPTKDENLRTLPLAEIEQAVDRFKEFANANPNMTFEVTPIGCGLAGYKPEQIGPFFRGAPTNCVIPTDFKRVSEEKIPSQAPKFTEDKGR